MSGIGIVSIVVGSVIVLMEMCYFIWWIDEDPEWHPVWFIALGERIDRHFKWKARCALSEKKLGTIRIKKIGDQFSAEKLIKEREYPLTQYKWRPLIVWCKTIKWQERFETVERKLFSSPEELQEFVTNRFSTPEIVGTLKP